MQALFEAQQRSDVDSIEQSQFNDKFALQIKALLEYGQYKQGFERVMRYADEIKPNVDLIIELASTFLECHQYEFTLEILKLSDLFNKQFELPRNDLLTLFKLYYVETLSQLEGAHHSLKLTKDIFDDDIRKEIQFQIHQILKSGRQPLPQDGDRLQQPQSLPQPPERNSRGKRQLVRLRLKKLLLLAFCVSLALSTLAVKPVRNILIAFLLKIVTILKKIVNL